MRILAGWKEPPNVLSLCLVALVASCFLAPFNDLDFTWQIRTGEQIVQSGQLRTSDEFSYTIAGQPVHDFEWLYEIGLYLVWSACGVGGLKLLKVLLVAAPLLIVGVHLHRQHVSWQGIILTLLTAVFILVPLWNLRALYCTTIGLLLVTGWLHNHCTGQRPLTWWLPLVMLLWANLHPGVIAGQGLLLGAILWEWGNRWLKLNAPLDWSGLKRLTLIGGVGLLATCVSPDPLARLLYPFRPELRHPIMRVFIEMQPLASVMGEAPLVVLLTYLVAALVAVSVVLRFREYRLWEIALLLVLAVLANLAIRGLQDWLLVMFLLGIPHLQKLLRATMSVRPGHLLAKLGGAAQGVFAGRGFRLQPAWVGGAFGILTVVALAWPHPAEVPTASICRCPVGAVDFIERQGLQGKFFAPPDFGSYLGWRLGPKAQVYVDTRGFFFPPHLLEDSHLLPQLSPGWQKRLERVLNHYPTDYLLLETTGPRGQLWQHLHAKKIEPLYLDAETVLVSAAQMRQSLLPQLAISDLSTWVPVQSPCRSASWLLRPDQAPCDTH